MGTRFFVFSMMGSCETSYAATDPHLWGTHIRGEQHGFLTSVRFISGGESKARGKRGDYSNRDDTRWNFTRTVYSLFMQGSVWSKYFVFEMFVVVYADVGGADAWACQRFTSTHLLRGWRRTRS